MRRWRVAVTAVAAFGMAAASGGLVLITGPSPALAAPAGLEIKASREVQGKPGDKASIGYEITNRTKEDIPENTVVVALAVPANAQLDPADFEDMECGAISNGRAVNCRLPNEIAKGKSVRGSFKIALKSGGNGSGRIGVRGGNAETFAVRVAGGPSPTKSASKASSSATAEPTDAASDVVIAPPEAGNGAIPQAEDPPAAKTGDSGGLSFGFWVGIVAILAALGLVGSLFYFRRKDREEPDTGMHPAMPGPAAGQAYGTPTPTTYGSTYGRGQHAQDDPGFGAQSGATTVFPSPPAGGSTYGSPAPQPPVPGVPPAAPHRPPVPPPAGPGGSDQTVIFRRPGDL
ncbi:hypothetical protein Drose_09345 [Dactylosporangium roseum]|uniref:DUF11 domain-containing protein n=1 Tax=Dactylosporangium roseum TaxID=47989 RepID=A0ABY5Z8L5_9ACTN|nr:hypothetical protein [Dactylosporangium roseum]UWZ38420.1 hypothetical protein Drose_09345 [Dactylosporangium roseum]